MMKRFVALLMFFQIMPLFGADPLPKADAKGTAIVAEERTPDAPPQLPRYRLPVKDHGPVMPYGGGPGDCDQYGARDVWVWEYQGTYYMHYDGAGPQGWLVCLATSKDLLHWTKKGAVLELGPPDKEDSATASYGVTYFDGKKWHMFYLASPNASPAPDRVPIGPYMTRKAEADSPEGPWTKRYDLPCFKPWGKDMPYVNTGPGQVLKHGDEYLMFFAGLDIAHAKDLNNSWDVPDKKHPALPQEACENSSIYYQPASKTWFMFTNHIGDGYTDAVWVYWTQDLLKWDSHNKAVVLDGKTCNWSKTVIGLPSVVTVGDKLALFYDGNKDPSDKWHMKRDVGLAWIDLPIQLPAGVAQ